MATAATASDWAICHGQARRRSWAFTSRAHHLLHHRWRWIVLGVVLLYGAAISTKWTVYPDSSVYLLLGKSLAAGDGYNLLGQPHGKYPPGFPLYLAAMYRLGLANMFWLNGLMALMGLGSLLLSYCLLRQHTGWRWAFLSTVVTATTYEVYRYSVAQLTDIPFLLLVSGGLCCMIRGCHGGRIWFPLGTLLLLVSCWVRVLGIPLALGALVGLVLQERQVPLRRVLLSGVVLVGGVAVTAAWLYSRDRALQTTAVAPVSYAPTVAKLSGGGPGGQLRRVLRNVYEACPALAVFFTGQRMPAWAAMGLIGVPVIVGGQFIFRRGHTIALSAAAAYLLAILLLQPPLARYYLPVGPILMLCFVTGIRTLSFTSRWRRWAPGLAIAVVLVLMMFNVPKVIRQVYRQHQAHVQSRPLYRDMVLVADYLKNQGGRQTRFAMGKHAPVVAYLTEMNCLSIEQSRSKQRMSEEEISQLLEKENIRFVIVRKEPLRANMFHRVIRRSIGAWPAFRLEYDQGDLQVFGRVPRGGSEK